MVWKVGGDVGDNECFAVRSAWLHRFVPVLRGGAVSLPLEAQELRDRCLASLLEATTLKPHDEYLW